MKRLNPVQLDPAAQRQLEKWQDAVNAEPTFKEQVALGKKQFASRNKRQNNTFNEVKKSLTEMCNGPRRCCYCEDSVADEVEHIRPKDFYPDQVFAFQNYLYACGPCNGPKSNRYAILPPGATEPLELNLLEEITSLPDPHSRHYLIDPRSEDPLEFLVLDLKDTFEFSKHPLKTGFDEDRANYTIDILALNSRDYLVKARKNAFGNYLARAEQYLRMKSENPGDPNLVLKKQEINHLDHPTVWAEMKRQRSRIPKLDDILASCPELL